MLQQSGNNSGNDVVTREQRQQISIALLSSVRFRISWREILILIHIFGFFLCFDLENYSAQFWLYCTI